MFNNPQIYRFYITASLEKKCRGVDPWAMSIPSESPSNQKLHSVDGYSMYLVYL